MERRHILRQRIAKEGSEVERLGDMLPAKAEVGRDTTKVKTAFLVHGENPVQQSYAARL